MSVRVINYANTAAAPPATVSSVLLFPSESGSSYQVVFEKIAYLTCLSFRKPLLQHLGSAKATVQRFPVRSIYTFCLVLLKLDSV